LWGGASVEGRGRRSGRRAGRAAGGRRSGRSRRRRGGSLGGWRGASALLLLLLHPLGLLLHLALLLLGLALDLLGLLLELGRLGQGHEELVDVLDALLGVAAHAGIGAAGPAQEVPVVLLGALQGRPLA